MLLPSILRILDQKDAQWNVPEPKGRVPYSKPEEMSGLKRIELEIAAAAELVKPSSATMPPSGTPSTGPFLEELLRAITKFEKSDQSRVVDVFE